MDYNDLITNYGPTWHQQQFYDHSGRELDQFCIPEIIEVEPIHFCNFNCIMCHVHFEEKMSRKKLDLDLVTRNLSHPAFKNSWLLVSSGYEGMAHPDISNFLNNISNIGMKIELTTNGSLLTDSLISQIKECNLKYVTFSFDGMHQDSYEYIREGANFDQTIKRISNFRQSLHGKDTYFNVNYTMKKRNIDEILDAVDYWDRLAMDQIYFIAMRNRPGGGKHQNESLNGILEQVTDRLDEAALDVIQNKRKITLASPVYKVSNLIKQYPSNIFHHIVKSDNPLARPMLNPRSYYQNGHYPNMPVDCRSPFKFLRIDFNGDVFLCQRYKIGNIQDHDLIEIWNSTAAKKIRRIVQSPNGPCEDCDHYKLCGKADELDIFQESSLLQTVPELVGHHLGFSIVKIKDKFHGFPAEVIYENAPIEPNEKVHANTLEELIQIITQHTLDQQ